MALRKLVAGNWKMNGTRAMLAELPPLAEAARAAPGIDVAICPPFTLLAQAAAQAEGLAIGGQDCHTGAKGPHTGCVSADMLRDAGATHVILGHSERRHEQGETDELVRAKAEAAQAAGLVAIVCVGETEAIRSDGGAIPHITAMIEGSLPPAATGDTLILAYEPVWAIGSGRTATEAEIAEMHAMIRAKLIALLGEAGAAVRILYGGSVTGENAAAIMALPDVDGVLVGGASLGAETFRPIIEAGATAQR